MQLMQAGYFSDLALCPAAQALWNKQTNKQAKTTKTKQNKTTIKQTNKITTNKKKYNGKVREKAKARLHLLVAMQDDDN